MKKILCVFGTRPEAIKMAPLILGLANHPNFEVKVCISAQHRSMLDQVLNLFDIKPDYDLNLMRANQSLAELTASLIKELPAVYQDFQPHRILVQGDTTTTFAASLAAHYHKIPIGHLEAGLRTGNMYSPWPEELNRKLTSMIADMHFAPTAEAKTNLLKENISSQQILVTGNTVIDALFLITKKLKASSTLTMQLKEQFSFVNFNKKIILVTGHRRESFGAGFQNICQALRQIALENTQDVEIIYPVHLNPNVQKPVKEILADIPNIHLIDPLDYLPFVYLLNASYFILTDSGGIQEEAPALGKPVLVMRETTERPEGIAAGTARLVGTSIDNIVKEASLLLEDEELYQKMSRAHNPYGDGTASQQIIAVLEEL